MKKVGVLLLGVCILLAACAQATEVPPTLEPTQEPTATKVPPTDTPEPTATKIPPTATDEPTSTPELPTQTPLPEGMLFRDEFEGELQPGWTWINEDANRWSFVEGGWLEIVGGDQGLFGEDEFVISNFLSREVPEGEFEITTHVQANPNENFQQATIYIFENPNNYIALNLGYCEPCSTGGPGFYMETIIDNNPFGPAYMIERSPNDTDVYLRLVNQGESLIGYYATTEGEWERIGAFGNYFEFKYVGLGATNSNPGGVENDIVARFDYFEITLPE